MRRLSSVEAEQIVADGGSSPIVSPFRIEPSAAPANASAGEMYFDAALGLRQFRSSSWESAGSSGAGYPPFVLIAGSDAPEAVISAADCTCDGTADQVQINTALAVDDDRPILLVGTFTTSAAIAFTDGVKHDLYGINEDATVIQGNHTGNVLEIHSASTPCEWRMTIANLHIDKGTSTPARGISVTNGSYLTFRNVRARRCTTNHYSYFGVHNAYYDCMFTDGTTGTQLTGAASAYSNLNRFYNCVWRANDVGTLFSARTERCSFFGCGWEDMASTDVGVKFAADTTIRGHGFTDCWFEGVGASVYPMEFLGGRNISFVRPRFAIANTQAVVKISGFAGKNVTLVDPHVDDGASLAGLPQGISVTSAGDNRMFNVTAFGALCDGTTDDTDAIQQAIDAAGTTGGTITGPKGTYLLSQQGTSVGLTGIKYCLRVPYDAGHITFDFPAGTVFKLANSQIKNTMQLVIDGESANTRTNGTTVRGITFDGNCTNQSSNSDDYGMITAVYANDILIEQCEFKNAYFNSIHILRNCTNVRIAHNKFDDTVIASEGNGAALRIETQDITVEYNYFVCDALAGRTKIQVGCNADILLQGRHMRIAGNIFAGGHAGIAVDLGGVTMCSVIGNVWRDVCDTSGTALSIGHYRNTNGTVYEAAHNVIEGNTFYNVRIGITLTSVADATIQSTKNTIGCYCNIIANNTFCRNMDDFRTILGGGSILGVTTYPKAYSPALNAAAVTMAKAINLSASNLANGTATAGAATTLTDGGAAYSTNQFQNYILVITGGTGVGQWRKITSNTGTVFTVPNWDVNPDSTSTYRVTSMNLHNVIRGNTIFCSGTTTKGIEDTSWLPQFIYDNVVYNSNLANGLLFGTAANNPLAKYRGNKGYTLSTSGDIMSGQPFYQDENSGTASVTSGNTSVTVTHGCGRTPTADQVMVWPLTTNGSATEWWVDTVGATTFKINVDANPAATYSFGWRIFGAM